ncbi:hypothetical protein ACJ41O_009274 [Fusarium nematophilum]
MQFVESKSAERLRIINPRNLDVMTPNVHGAGAEDVELAVAAAKDAFATGPWSAQSGSKYAGWADKLAGESFPSEDGFMRIVKHEPIGVCAAICAWNASLMFFAWKAALALATGNVIIMKSSEKSPLGFLALGKLVIAAGFPPGVVQFLNGAAETGKALALHPDIGKITFTGSGNAGRKILEASSKSNLKRVTLELGGKSPTIVFPDADFENALRWCSSAIMINAGQVCATISRLYIHKDIAPEFIKALKGIYYAAAEQMGPGDGPMGVPPVADEHQLRNILSYIEAGKKDAELAIGGVEKDVRGEEIFGPVLTAKVFESEDQVTDWANDSEYGLAAAVFTKDIDRALRIADRIKAGSIAINSGPSPSPKVPFGGVKQSGLGRELGKYALDEYTETKSIFIKFV